MDFLERASFIVYTSPSGKVFQLRIVGDVSYKRKHNGEVKENPKSSSKNKTGKKQILDSNDTFQDKGMSGIDITLDCLFIGDNHDIEADAFIQALCEIGKSRLQLLYGGEITVNVLDFSVKNSMLEKINSTVVSVNFHQTAQTSYPKSKESAKNKIKEDAFEVDMSIAEDLDAQVQQIAQNATRAAAFQANFTKCLGAISDGLDAVNDVSIDSIMQDLANQSIIQSAFTMTRQIQIVMQKGARLAARVQNIASEIPSFGAFGVFGEMFKSFKSLTETKSSISDALRQSEIDNLILNDAMAKSALAALAETLVVNNYDTRKEATDAAQSLIAIDSDWNAYVDEQAGRIDDLKKAYIRDSNSTDLTAAAVGEILQQSYSLKIEKTIVLSEDTTILELAAEHYADEFKENPDETVAYLLKTNGFGDDEFFMLERGQSVKFYV